MVKLTSMIPSAAIAAVAMMSQQANVQAASAIDLGDCTSFAIMGGTAINFNGVTSTVAMGSIGVSPAASITGSYVVADGTVNANTAAAINCASSMMTAFLAAAGTTCTNTTTPTDLGGLTLGPGVYCNTGGYFLVTAGTLTLTGSATDVWIFQTATFVNTYASTNIVLAGGALASNVFWQVGTSVETGPFSSFVGTILAGTGITIGSTATLDGRALSQTAVICTSTNTVTSFVSGYSAAPTMNPSATPSTQTTIPSAVPTLVPGTSEVPSAMPTVTATAVPSATPSVTPSAVPSAVPSKTPSTTPSAVPSSPSTSTPSAAPSTRTPSPAPSVTRAPTAATSAIDLGDCIDFAVMAGTAVNFNGVLSTVAVGSVGTSPGLIVAGSYGVSSGSVERNTAAAISCATSMSVAYLALAGTACTHPATSAELGGMTLTAGVYCNTGGSYGLSGGALTLHGSATDVWIFQAATSVTTAASTSIVLTGGALAKNVFWQLGTTLTTGATSSFVGTVLAGTSITMGTSSTLNGRALAQAAVSMSSGNTVTSFVSGYSNAPSASPTNAAGAASQGSSTGASLTDGNITAIVVMSVVGIIGLSIAAYFGYVDSRYLPVSSKSTNSGNSAEKELSQV